MDSATPSISMDYASFERLVQRFASAVDKIFKLSYPNSPDRGYIERSLLADWGRSLIQDSGRELLAQELEYMYRLGESLPDMVAQIQGFERNRYDQTLDSDALPPPPLSDEKVAFKYTVRLFAYRLLAYKKLNSASIAKIIDALPSQPMSIGEFTMHSVVQRAQPLKSHELTLNSNPVALSPADAQSKEPKMISWLGTQKQLAELFIRLEEKRWIEAPVPSAIKRAFTKSHTIEQPLKPGLSDRSNKRHYPDVFTTEYQSMFNGIAENEKK